ncbi:MAG: hypothetical protein KDK70_31260 [Myxococcales bacterium]|nr:hypothetical protein [Myxococcales bacterium]
MMMVSACKYDLDRLLERNVALVNARADLLCDCRVEGGGYESRAECELKRGLEYIEPNEQECIHHILDNNLRFASAGEYLECTAGAGEAYFECLRCAQAGDGTNGGCDEDWTPCLDLDGWIWGDSEREVRCLEEFTNLVDKDCPGVPQEVEDDVEECLD